MILVFDIGNTRLKWAVWTNGSLGSANFINYRQLSKKRFEAKLDRELSEIDNIESIWISSVGSNSKSSHLKTWLASRFQSPVIIAQSTKYACGISNGYHDLESLGVDRWVAAIGARSIKPQGDLIILDAGTALTIDWLSSDNVFEGGVILPGAELMHDALIGRTSKILSEPSAANQIIGKTTKECVNSGLAYGLVGAVERIIIEMQKTIDKPLSLVLTGGGADAIVAKTDLEFVFSPQLVLQGLVQLASENKQ